jgi:hypothetical protein
MNELDDVNIRHFKLSSGEELISLVKGDENTMIILESPMELHTMMKEQTQGFVFTKWQPLSKTDIVALNPMHIVSHVECDNDIKERYIRMCLEQKDYPEELEDPSYDDSPEELDMLEAMMELNSTKTKLH